MERLTKRIKRLQKDDLIVYTKGKYEGAIPAEMTNDDIRAILKKLATYEDLEEQGLLVRLPCNVGDTVYRVMAEYVRRSDVIKIMEDNLQTVETPEARKKEMISAYEMYRDFQKLETIEINENRGINMKPEEALKELNYDDTAYGGKCTYEVRKTAVDALEKQIPKEPKYKKQLRDFFGVATVVKGDCPCCGKAEIYSNANYCPDCGQRLDWSKKNNDI